MTLKCVACFDKFFFTFLTFITLGMVSVSLLVAIIAICTLQPTEFDTTILTWVIVAFCVSLVVLSYSIFAQLSLWRFSKFVLAAIYAIFDIFLLFCGIAIFILRSKVVANIGKLWSSPDSSHSSIVEKIEESLKCCGFDDNNKNCDTAVQNCKEALETVINSYGNAIGGVVIGLCVLLAVGVVVSFVRAWKGLKERNAAQGPEIVDFDDNETFSSDSRIVWF